MFLFLSNTIFEKCFIWINIVLVLTAVRQGLFSFLLWWFCVPHGQLQIPYHYINQQTSIVTVSNVHDMQICVCYSLFTAVHIWIYSNEDLFMSKALCHRRCIRHQNETGSVPLYPPHQCGTRVVMWSCDLRSKSYLINKMFLSNNCCSLDIFCMFFTPLTGDFCLWN